MSERRSAPHLSPWGRLVLVCAAVVGACAIAIAIGALVTRTERLVTGVVRGSLNGVSLDLGDANVEIIRGGNRESVELERTEQFTFDHGPVVERRIAGSTLRLRSRCPDTLLHTCSADYRLIVPDNVPVEIGTKSGGVRFGGFRGSVDVSTGSGDITRGLLLRLLARRADAHAGHRLGRLLPAAAAHAALDNRAGAAIVPPGRYRVDAESTPGRACARRGRAPSDAPFTIQALSTSGDVTVESRRRDRARWTSSGGSRAPVTPSATWRSASRSRLLGAPRRRGAGARRRAQRRRPSACRCCWGAAA